MALGKFTDIIVLLDRSVSMASIAGATRSSFNEFIASQQEIEGDARLTLAQFSDHGDFGYTYINLPLRAVQPLTVYNYSPNGHSTALLDAVGRLIDGIGARYANALEPGRPEKVVFVILTDGQENNSQRFSKADIRQRIQLQSDVYKWQFVYLGANQDAILAARELAIPATSSVTYNATELGLNNTVKSFGEKVSLLRTRPLGTYTVNFNDTDRVNSMAEGKLTDDNE